MRGAGRRRRTASDRYPRTVDRRRRSPAINCSGVTIARSEEHTSELQSRGHLVCRLLLEKKKKHYTRRICSSVSRKYPETTPAASQVSLRISYRNNSVSRNDLRRRLNISSGACALASFHS